MLLSEDLRGHLSDMGVSQVLGGASAATAVGCSHVYAAPEQLLGKRCTLAADMCVCCVHATTPCLLPGMPSTDRQLGVPLLSQRTAPSCAGIPLACCWWRLPLSE